MRRKVAYIKFHNGSLACAIYYNYYTEDKAKGMFIFYDENKHIICNGYLQNVTIVFKEAD